MKLTLKNPLIVLGIICLASVIWLKWRPATFIFTCTTYFDFEKQDKWTAFCRAMDSIQSLHTPDTLHRIGRWLIVNEYSAKPKADWAVRIREKYPFVNFIQKGVTEKGQAASMNIILNEIASYRYWIHWEETWYCTKPCLDRLMTAIEDTNISQIQCTRYKGLPNWTDSIHHPREPLRTARGVEIIRIYPSKETEKYLLYPAATVLDGDGKHHWPLYSLLPSINRVSVATTVGPFPTDPALWPIKFEWDYARRWYSSGGTKAVLPDGPVQRDEAAHKSTYA